MIAEGTYRGKPVQAALGLTGNGKEQIGVLFEFIDPPGQRLTWYGFFTEDTYARTIEALRFCGWQGQDLSDFVDGKPLPAGFDQEVELVVEHQEYQGKVSARVAWVNSGGGLALKTALTDDQARAFAARMKGKIIALDRARPARQSGPVSVGAPRDSSIMDVPDEVLDRQAGEIDGEELPF
jgi:hypothetical protein